MFKVTNVSGEKAYTSFHGLECLRDYISRLVRKRTTRIDTVQDLVTKDGVKLRVKTIAISLKKMKSSIKKSVMNYIREVIKEEAEKSKLPEFINKILKDEIKKKIIEGASKIYPLRHFEVRKIEVLPQKREKTRTEHVEKDESNSKEEQGSEG